MANQALRKTTVYLTQDDVLSLRKMANLRSVTMAEAIRISIKEACRPKTKEEKSVWNALDKIWAKTEAIDPGKIENLVNKTVKEVRSAKKARRRS